MDYTATTGRQHEPTVRPAPRGWRRAALAVPVLVVVAFVMFAVFVPMSNGHTQHDSAACRWTALPWTVWAVTYGGLVAAVAAIALRIVLGRLARRSGWSPDSTWHGRLATASAIIGGLALAMMLFAVVTIHLQASEIAANLGKPMCEG